MPRLVTVVPAVAGLALTAAAQQPRPDASLPVEAAISGVAFDSMAMRPLAEALVQLAEVPRQGRVGMVRSTRSDSTGRYSFAGVPAGTYLIGFQHVAIDSLGLRASVQRVDVRTVSRVRVDLAIPSVHAIIASVCGSARPGDSLAVLVGSVRDARTDAPVARSFVSFRWGEIVLSRGGMRRDTPIVDVYADDDGWFATCVPGGVPVLTRASHANDVSGAVEIVVPALALLRRDIYVGYAEAEIVGQDSVRRAGAAGEGERIVARGRGSARGIVRGTNGRPVAGARVGVLASPSEARTDEQGQFVLSGVPHGTHTIEARALGFLPDQAIIDIVAFREASAEFFLVDLKAVMLDTVNVAAARHLDAAARAGFERRRRAGSGYFIDENQIDTMRVFAFRDLLSTIPGVRFVRGSQIGETWREHVEFTMGGRSAGCLPAIYLDGSLLVSGPTTLDEIVSPATVRRIEVYHRGLAVPAEFASAMRCGILAIWTGSRVRAKPGGGSTYP